MFSPWIFRIFLIVAAVAYTYQEGSEFSCEGRVTGYYADVENGCRTYHYCTGSNRYTYECPNNTLFQQRIFICNHWYLVDCEGSERFYDANLLIGQRDKPFVGENESHVATTQTVVTPYALLRAEAADASRKSVSVSTEGTNLGYYSSTVDPISSTASLELEDIQRVEQEVATAPPPTSLLRTGKANDPDEGNDGFIKLKFSDPRGLFYIPNDNNSLETVSQSFREFLIPKSLNRVELMQFKEQANSEGDIVCPRYCHPKFLKPGTCHPCIMIK